MKRGVMGLEGFTLYVTAPPCSECAKLINKFGVSEVVCLNG